jgi:hypothetical protein
MTRTPGRSYSGALKPLSQQEIQIRDNLKKSVQVLSDTIGDRNTYSYQRLKLSKDYIAKELETLGFEVSCQKYKEVKNILYPSVFFILIPAILSGL